jgi:hypothetical protein
VLDRLSGDRRDVVEQSIDVRFDLEAALFAGGGDADRVDDLLGLEPGYTDPRS